MRSPSDRLLGIPKLSTRAQSNSIQTAFAGAGWKTVFWGESGPPRGRGSNQKWTANVPLTRGDVDELTNAFFGPLFASHEPTPRRVLAVQVLLAALTIQVKLTSEKANEMGRPDVRWMFGGREGFLEAKLRVACGIGSDEDKSLKGDYDEADDNVDDYDDEDDDDEDEYCGSDDQIARADSLA